ncbi:MAG: sigma factor-like helix-turn-helix DNA-binding protein [Ilumatobacteraceae bacterium]
MSRGSAGTRSPGWTTRSATCSGSGRVASARSWGGAADGSGCFEGSRSRRPWSTSTNTTTWSTCSTGCRPAQRSAVLLIKAHGCSYAETAELRGISEAAVTNHLHRGLKRLRASLEATT